MDDKYKKIKKELSRRFTEHDISPKKRKSSKESFADNKQHNFTAMRKKWLDLARNLIYRDIDTTLVKLQELQNYCESFPESSNHLNQFKNDIRNDILRAIAKNVQVENFSNIESLIEFVIGLNEADKFIDNYEKIANESRFQDKLDKNGEVIARGDSRGKNYYQGMAGLMKTMLRDEFAAENYFNENVSPYIYRIPVKKQSRDEDTNEQQTAEISDNKAFREQYQQIIKENAEKIARNPKSTIKKLIDNPPDTGRGEVKNRGDMYRALCSDLETVLFTINQLPEDNRQEKLLSLIASLSEQARLSGQQGRHLLELKKGFDKAKQVLLTDFKTKQDSRASDEINKLTTQMSSNRLSRLVSRKQLSSDIKPTQRAGEKMIKAAENLIESELKMVEEIGKNIDIMTDPAILQKKISPKRSVSWEEGDTNINKENASLQKNDKVSLESVTDMPLRQLISVSKDKVPKGKLITPLRDKKNIDKNNQPEKSNQEEKQLGIEPNTTITSLKNPRR